MLSYIAIEGCMGAGKTTLARELAKALTATPLLEESGRHPFIREFYLAPDAHALETELAFILLHYHQIIRERRQGIFNGTVVADFALARDYVFATLTLTAPEDWRLFVELYSALVARLQKPDCLIYLRAPVDFLARRVAQRGRDYESRMTRGYLERVSGALDSFFINEYDGHKLILSAAELDSSVNPGFVDSVLAHLTAR